MSTHIESIPHYQYINSYHLRVYELIICVPNPPKTQSLHYIAIEKFNGPIKPIADNFLFDLMSAGQYLKRKCCIKILNRDKYI